MTYEAGIYIALAAPFVAALLAPVCLALLGRLAGPVLALIPGAVFFYFVSMIPAVTAAQRIFVGVDWLPGFSVRFSFLLDGLSLVFALLISGIGSLIILYAGGYMKGHPQAGRLLSFLFLFMGSMLGLVLADDSLLLFVFWEGTSITSFLLIGFDHSYAQARRAAFQALVITGAGGLCLLAAVLLIGSVSGAHSLSAILNLGDGLKVFAVYPVILALVLAAAFTKSAQVPFHSWLPNAMAAPTPVSAYLHSATMVKAGVYLLMRLQPALGQTPEWTTSLTFFGALTLAFGALHALRRTDLKLMLADTTVASLGLLVLLVGVGTDAALLGATVYLVAHAFFKGALFMVAGIIDHEAGTRDIRRLSGLARAMPVTFLSAGLAALSMAGLPPALGFIAKETLYAGLIDKPALAAIAIAVIANALMLVIGAVVALKPFLGKPVAGHEGPPEMLAGPLVLALSGLAVGLLIGPLADLFFLPMASVLAGHQVAFDLHLVPAHIEPPLILSAITIVLGLAIFLNYQSFSVRTRQFFGLFGWGADRGFDQFITGLLRFSRFVVKSVQPGRLEAYVTASMLVLVVTLFWPMITFGGLPTTAHFALPGLVESGLFAIAILGLIAVLIARTRLIAVVSLGIQGFATAVLFMLFGAPDLAFTQFMVETLSVVILALVLTRLSLADRDHRPVLELLRDGTIAILVGAGFALLLISATNGPFDRRLTDFYDAHSYAIAHGRNIVNVIIVDFRGLDTLGEISVVMVTGLAILALLRLRKRSPIGQEDHAP